MQALRTRGKKDVAPATARRRGASTARWSEALIGIANAINIVLQLAVPCVVIAYTKADPVPGLFVVLTAATLMMKLISYAQANRDYRCCAIYIV